MHFKILKHPETFQHINFFFPDNIKQMFLQLVVSTQEQIVQLERQKTLFIERTPSPLDLRPTTPAASERKIYINLTEYLIFIKD